MITALYCRRSKRGEAGKFDTVESQEAELRAYAAEQGFEPLEVYRERGVSAGREADVRRRVFYGQVMPAIRDGRIKRLLVVEVDRLSRFQLAFWQIVEECRTLGCEVYATRSGTYVTDPRTSVLELALRAGLASEESRIRSDRQKSHRQRMREAGRIRSGGFRLYGYEKDGITIRPDEAALINRSADDFLAGASIRSIALRWAEEGVKNHYGKPPAPKSIRNTLANSDLIDADRRARIRAILNDENRRGNKAGFNRRTYLLTRLVRCSCGAYLVSWPSGKNRYYRCHLNPADGNFKACRQTKVNADALEHGVLTAIRHEARDALLAQFGNGHSDAVAVLEAERSRLDAQEERIGDMAADGTLTKEQVKRQNEKLAAEQADLETRIRAAAERDIVARSLEEFAKGPLHDFDWWRSLIERTVERIVVQPSGKFTIYLVGGETIFHAAPDPPTDEPLWKRARKGGAA